MCTNCSMKKYWKVKRYYETEKNCENFKRIFQSSLLKTQIHSLMIYNYFHETINYK